MSKKKKKLPTVITAKIPPRMPAVIPSVRWIFLDSSVGNQLEILYRILTRNLWRQPCKSLQLSPRAFVGTFKRIAKPLETLDGIAEEISSRIHPKIDPGILPGSNLEVPLEITLMARPEFLYDRLRGFSRSYGGSLTVIQGFLQQVLLGFLQNFLQRFFREFFWYHH